MGESVFACSGPGQAPEIEAMVPEAVTPIRPSEQQRAKSVSSSAAYRRNSLLCAVVWLVAVIAVATASVEDLSPQSEEVGESLFAGRRAMHFSGESSFTVAPGSNWAGNEEEDEEDEVFLGASQRAAKKKPQLKSFAGKELWEGIRQRVRQETEPEQVGDSQHQDNDNDD